MFLGFKTCNQWFFFNSRLFDSLLEWLSKAFKFSSSRLWFPSMKTYSQLTESWLNLIHWNELTNLQSSIKIPILDMGDYLFVMLTNHLCILDVQKFLICWTCHDFFILLHRREFKPLTDELGCLSERRYINQLML